MKKSDAVDDITHFINHYDGGSIQSYVTEKLVDFLVDQLGMLPPEVVTECWRGCCAEKQGNYWEKDCE